MCFITTHTLQWKVCSLNATSAKDKGTSIVVNCVKNTNELNYWLSSEMITVLLHPGFKSTFVSLSLTCVGWLTLKKKMNFLYYNHHNRQLPFLSATERPQIGCICCLKKENNSNPSFIFFKFSFHKLQCFNYFLEVS